MKKLMLTMAITALSFGAQATNKSYVKNVMALEQRILTNPHPSGDGKRFEGCGPIAAASILGYFQTEKGYKTMQSGDDFTGFSHPSKTIKKFYKEAPSRKAPAKGTYEPDGKRYNQSYTLPDKMVKGLKHFVNKANKKRGRKAKLRVERAKAAPFKTWEKRVKTLESQLKKNRPVIMLIHNIPGCLTAEDSKTGGWHYVVAVGHNRINNNLKSTQNKLYILSGWHEFDKNQTYGPAAHIRGSAGSNGAHIECNYQEIKKTNPALFWVQ
tara:strand:- start:361 stop:1164 length:804 start_codon:yes stop_codon:yes gene_type:complete